MTLGFAQETAGQATVLASSYALDLGIPFLATGLGMDRAVKAARKLRPYTPHRSYPLAQKIKFHLFAPFGTAETYAHCFFYDDSQLWGNFTKLPYE